jgi:hypothetical protein
MKMFKRLRHRQATRPPLPVVQHPRTDLLWNEIASTIASAGIHIRNGDDVPAIVDVPGYSGFKYETGEARRFFAGNFPGITDELMAHALRYLNSHVIAAMRRADAKAVASAQGDGGTRWRDWRPYK